MTNHRVREFFVQAIPPVLVAAAFYVFYTNAQEERRAMKIEMQEHTTQMAEHQQRRTARELGYVTAIASAIQTKNSLEYRPDPLYLLNPRTNQFSVK
jgi:hypothetical protein